MAVYVSIRDGMTNADQADLQHFDNAFGMEGVIEQQGAYGLAVTENGSPNMSVNVSAGECLVRKTSWTPGSTNTKFYHVINTAAITAGLVIAANPGATRIDLVCVKIDEAASPDANASNVGSVLVVQGVSGAGVPATPSNHLKLAEVTVGTSVSSITNSNITDKRPKSRLKTGLILPEGVLDNGVITRTIAANAITVAIKTLAGNDPSTEDPVRVRINNAIYFITSALSITLASGTNYYNLNKTATVGQSIDLSVSLVYKASTGAIGINLGLFYDSPTRTYGDWSSTSTAQQYLASSQSGLASTDRIVMIGRVSASLNASNQWSIGSVDNIIQVPVNNSREMSHVGTYTATGSMTVGGSPAYNRNWKIVDNFIELYTDTSGLTFGGVASDAVILATPARTLSTLSGAFIGCGYNSQSGYLGGLQISGVADELRHFKVSGGNYALATSTQLTGFLRFRGL